MPAPDPRYGGAALFLAVLAMALLVGYERLGHYDPRPVGIAAAHVERLDGSMIEPGAAPPRTLDPYVGYGAWVDVFDFSPAYAGPRPSVTADDVDEMAAGGVRTVFLQSARLDDRSPDGLEDPWSLAELLHRAHARGMAVVAWYLPEWSTDRADLDRVEKIDRFEVLGQRFDGIALDIEWTADDLDPEERGRRLVALSQAARATVDGPLGAIVLPPVLTEVINEELWPAFPWTDIAPVYDVWLPMSYWSFRSDASGYGDGYSYNAESTRRLRANVGDEAAPVHGIGGIGGVDGVDDDPDPPEPLTTLPEIEAFVASLEDTESIGGSMYDWNTLEPTVRPSVAGLFASASLGSPPP